jgi:hypothetical protein
MMKSLIIGVAVVGGLAGASLAACGPSNLVTTTSSGPGGTSAASTTSTTSGSGTGGTTTASSSTTTTATTSTSTGTGAGGGPSTTIAGARMGNVTGSITVDAVVTAVQGPSGDEVNYYIEDPAGGPYSGVDVYCDPLETKCPAGPKAGNPSVGDYVRITGTLSTYKGQLELEPTVYTLIASGHALPAPVTVQGSDIAASNASAQYRGVLVKVAETLTVTNLTPSALYNTTCAIDAGMPLCSGCTPPSYSGFQASDSASDVIYVEQYLFPGDPLQSSPECVDAGGQVAVTTGETFPFMVGIVDYDPYASAQFLAPRSPTDY